MRYLVLTDIHANLEALDACLADARPRGYDESLVLGDLVGYGGDPNAVVERVQALNAKAIVRGNHDKVACGLEQAEGFNAVARSAAKWTLEVLTPAYRDWLCALPEGPIDVDDVVEICHGSPFDEDAYIFDELDAVRALKVSNRPLCLFGHTHVQVGHHLRSGEFGLATGEDHRPLTLSLGNGTRYLINPGSVGQPRDGDPRAGFGLVDTSQREITIYRVDYPIHQAQARIAEEGLPEVLAERLALGR